MKKFNYIVASIIVTILTACSTPSANVAPPINEAEIKADLNQSISTIDAFLKEYDDTTIEEEKTQAIFQNSIQKTFSKGLPPKNNDLFASGLYMPFDDNNHIYHDYDHIYYKVVEGSWNLDAVKNSTKNKGYVFTKEDGMKK